MSALLGLATDLDRIVQCVGGGARLDCVRYRGVDWSYRVIWPDGHFVEMFSNRRPRTSNALPPQRMVDVMNAAFTVSEECLGQLDLAGQG
ncbi:MAG: hypothetical protein ABMB14_33335 [Myxococcota bacterium]